MYFTASEDVANEVEYAMSRLELDSDICDAGKNILEMITLKYSTKN